ncbi:MAG: hypothetical protein SX243_21545 [Acidobacteriota bacterium]|nr:hypothetical protein [Acidobacteriota bacterium]
MGDFRGTAFFGSGILTSEGLNDFFVVKYDVNGDVVWAASGGGPSVDVAYDLAVDDSQNVYVTGYFSGTAEFTSGGSGGVALVQLSGTDAYGELFVAKLDIDGNWEWARQAGHDGGQDEGRSIAVIAGDETTVPPTPDGVVVAGYAWCPVFYDEDGTAASGLAQDTFCAGTADTPSALVARLDTAGNWVWAKSGGADDTREELMELAVDSTGALFVAGQFYSTVNLAGSTLNPTGSVPDLRLEFYHRLNTESRYDGGVLEYSVDGGAWTDILAASGGVPADSGRFLENGYNSTVPGGYYSPLIGRQVWSGDNGGFQRVLVDLSDFAFREVRFRWRFAQDVSVADQGWWVDDVRIYAESGGVQAELFNEDFEDGLGDWNFAQGPCGGGGICLPQSWFLTTSDSRSASQSIFVQDTAFGTLGIPLVKDEVAEMRPTVTLGSLEGTPFLAKLQDNGTDLPDWEWAEQLPQEVNVWDLAAYEASSTERYLDVAGFQSGAGSFGGYTLPYSSGAFLARLQDGEDAATDFTWEWASGASGGIGRALAHDDDGNVYVTGEFTDQVVFPDSVGTYDAVVEDDGVTGSTDVYVAGVDGTDGSFEWALTAGGSGEDRGFGIATDGTENVYVSGDFEDTALFGDRELVAGQKDVFTANLELDDSTGDGEWFTITLEDWVVGAEVPAPSGAFLDPDYPVESQPEISIDAPGSAIPDYFFYSASEAKLYALQPVAAEVRWKVPGDGGGPPDLTDPERIIVLGESRLPDTYCPELDPVADACRQVHIAGAPAEIERSGLGLSFASLVTTYSSSASTDAAVEAKVFNATSEGFSVLLYALAEGDPDTSNNPVAVEVVETLPYNTNVEAAGTAVFENNAACTVGKRIEPPAAHDEPGRGGYVLFERAFFDASEPYDRDARLGSIFPVNEVNPNTSDGQDLMAVAWYQGNSRSIYWPSRSVLYDCQWPVQPDKIIIASEQGSEVLGQPVLDPAIYPNLILYNQPDASLPGFNPNDEHAVMLPGTLGTGFDAIFAVRADFALTASHRDASEPYVLARYYDSDAADYDFLTYQVLATGAGYNEFQYTGTAGTKIFAPYPVRLLGGCAETSGSGDPFFLDYQNAAWAKADGDVTVQYWYPLQSTFYYDRNRDGVQDAAPLECIPWMDLLPGTTPPGDPIEVSYRISWPDEIPSLLVGETLLKPKRGLPNIVDQASAEIVFDELLDRGADGAGALAQLIDPLNPRTVQLVDQDGTADADGNLPTVPLTADIATELDPETGLESLVASADGTIKLPFHLRSRLIYNPLLFTLTFQGYFEEQPTGEPLLLLNVMTDPERETLLALSSDADYQAAIEELYDLSRNPRQLDLQDVVGVRDGEPDQALLIGVQDACYGDFCRLEAIDPADADGNPTPIDPDTGLPVGDGIPEPLQVLGNSPALTAGAAQGTGYLTLAFNNHPSLNPLPVNLTVIDVSCLLYPEPPDTPEVFSPYQGELLVIESDNVFDEQLTLRHSGDFGGASDQLIFEWYTHPDSDGTPPMPLPDPEGGQLNGWLQYPVPDAQGAVDITIEGANLQTLSDNWFVVRYRGLPACGNDTGFSVFAGKGGTPLEPRAQLAEGWIKRVVRGLNPFEARVQDFHSAPTNTYASMLVQLGKRYEGDIAFNPTADNLNSIGLIEAYETVLRRGLSLSVGGTPPVDYPPANTALLLVASRINDFYNLLGNEAYADAQDPMIGFGTDSGVYGTLAPAIFSFQNQLASLLEEELVLLRGRDGAGAPVEVPPVYNRLFWNFTSGQGEFAYALGYNITDQDLDGVVDVTDASILFPQGHGDAWGHYLTGVKTYYQLLRHPFFTWIPTQEAVLVGGTPVQVDFFDERQFAATAASKAQVGAEIVDLTYRARYVEDPSGQWQGYKDSDADRAWGLSEWGRRAGQGAYFDWVVGNAILPEEDADPDHVGIQKVDRTTVEELDEIVGHFADIQTQLDEADQGLNPLGVAKGVVPFDIDPSLVNAPLGFAQTHFEQIYDRADQAMDNAVAVFNHANQLTELLRRNQDTVDDLTINVTSQERSYKNRLIEIFGYPYSDDIGPGGTYPAGYNGPDLYHYMYVDQTDLTGTREQPVQVFTAEFEPLGAVGFFDFSPDADCTDPFGDGCSLSSPPSTPMTVEYHRSGSADSYALIKPPAWTGARRATGELQDRLSDLLVALNSYEQILQQYDNLLVDIEDAAELLEVQYQVGKREIQIRSDARNEVNNLNVAIGVLQATQIGLRRAADGVRQTFEAADECVPDSVVVGFSNGGDIFAAVECTLEAAKLGASFFLDVAADAVQIAENSTALAKEDVALQADLEVTTLNNEFEVLQKVKELEALLREEPLLRLEAYARREIIEQEKGNYLAALAKGQRLLAELAQFRRNTAADVQVYRYQDMAFRVFRNDALQKYRAQFDLTARYAYLAAAAYDYETNLLGDDPQGGQDFFTDIVRQRSLGQLIDGEPVPGSRGLADPLARMDQNFEVLKTQLGFNNPQTETNRFSLRRELFRLQDDSDEDWRDLLEGFRVDNLWDYREFRRFARPFAPEVLGPQPGLIIPFSTTVTFGLNFFGWPLAAGDSAYDPSNFSTRVRSVGVWLDEYPEDVLSQTPRVYLMPVGADVLRPRSGDDFTTREWSVVDQVLPVPFPIGGSDLTDPDWIPVNDSLSADFGAIRRFSSFRAYPYNEPFDADQTTADSRLIGRSVWNTRWVLIIPGGTLLFDAEEGLESLINGQPIPGQPGMRDGEGIEDIHFFFQTYAISGN